MEAEAEARFMEQANAAMKSAEEDAAEILAKAEAERAKRERE